MTSSPCQAPPRSAAAGSMASGPPSSPHVSLSRLMLGCFDMGLSFLGRSSAPFWVPLLPSPATTTATAAAASVEEEAGAESSSSRGGVPPPPPTFDLWRLAIERVTISALVPPTGGLPPAASGGLDVSAAAATASASAAEAALSAAADVVQRWLRARGASAADASASAAAAAAAGLGHSSAYVGLLASAAHDVLLPPPLLVRLVAMTNTVG